MRSRVHGAARLAALVGLALAASSCGGCAEVKRFMYEGFDRDEWQRPDEVVAALALAPGQQVADLGAGGGYFTLRFARAVGPEGRVFAIDVDPDMVAYLEQLAADAALPQVVPVLAEPDDAKLADASVDLVFVSNTFHHIEQRITYFARLRRALRPGGRVAVVELSKNFFPPGHRTPPEEIQKDMDAAGYTRLESHDFLPRQSFQIFAPRVE